MGLSDTQWVIIGAVGAGAFVIILSIVIYVLLRISMKRKRRVANFLDDNVMSTSDSDAIPLIDNNLQSDEDMVVARTYLRGTPYTFEKELNSISTESRTYFSVLSPETKQKKLLSVIDIGMGKFPELPEKSLWKSLMKNLKHPLLNQVHNCDYIPEKGKVIVISDMPEKSTLKEISSKKIFKNVNEEDLIPNVLRYLLEALFGLERIGIILPGISMEQICLDKNYNARLNGIEDAFLGCSDSISASITFSIDDPRQPHPHVIAVGCILYELVCGQEIGDRHWYSVCDEVETVLEDRDNIPSEYKTILRRIFNSDMDDYDVTIQSLLNEPPFSYVNITASMTGATMPKLTPKFQNFINEVCSERLKGVVPSVSQVAVEDIPSESTSSVPSSSKNKNKPKTKSKKKKSTKNKTDQEPNQSSASSSENAPPTPAPPPPPSSSGGGPPVPPPPPPSMKSMPKPQEGRGQLLSDIRSFAKDNLKQVE